MDGFVIALSPWVVRNIRFDESLGQLHGYDLDFCLQVRAFPALDAPLGYALRAQLRRHINGPAPSPENLDDLPTECARPVPVPTRPSGNR